MKQKILFCIENFQHGGITKALENIILRIDKSKYDIGIFVVNRENGPYKTLFSPYLKYNEDNWLNYFCTNYRKYSGIKRAALISLKVIRKCLAKLNLDIFECRLNQWAKRISDDRYDCVIAYAEGYITDFVSKIKGNKVAWIHIDYKRYLSYTDNINERHIYDKYNQIVIPSQFSSRTFIDIFPEFADKVKVIPNVIDIDNVKSKAAQLTDIDKRFTIKCNRIISVGRICYEKRFYEIPYIAKKLHEKQLDFKWYIIGDGSEIETATLTQAIKSAGIEDYVILLGRKDNPYPYIAQSDLLVSTSISETFSYVVFEAKTLGTPVVCADFGTAPEIINDGEGIISPIKNMDTVIYELLSDKNKLKTFNKNLTGYSYDNDKIMHKIYSTICNR